MQYDLNLARRPFVNIAVPSLLALVVTVGIIAFTVVNVSVLMAEPEGEVGYEQRIEEAMSNLRRIETEIASTERRLGSEEAGTLSGRIKFANELIARQKLNWTRLFDRLEEITPPSVRMLQISPYFAEGSMALMLRIEESAPEAALDFVQALGASPFFGQVSLEDESPSDQESGQIWRLRVSYRNR
ncbi:MAG TPA: hypothetical protein VMX35_05600 [Acidobacteriota bacterium]|nr:hypothetical protein [Acidobacteriota bacterium]